MRTPLRDELLRERPIDLAGQNLDPEELMSPLNRIERRCSRTGS